MSRFRKGRFHILAVAFLLGAVLLLACQPAQPAATPQAGEKAAAEKPVRGGTVRAIWASGDPPTLDPHGAIGMSVMWSLYDSLIQPDKDWKVTKEGLLKDWTISSDGKAITFKLREGVKFHDGTDFDAEAVKFNVERIKDPATKSVYRSFYASVDAVEVVDKATVRFKLSAPDPVLLPRMTTQGAGLVVSPTAVKKFGQDYGRNPVGAGPFQFVEWVFDDHITLKRFPGYWGKDKDGNQLPYLDGVVFQVIGADTATAVANLRSGQADTYTTFPPQQLPLLKADPNLTYTVRQEALMYGLIMNTKVAPFDKKAVRQAVALAINRESMAAAQGEGGATAEPSILHPNHLGYDPQKQKGVYPARDVAKAKAKMAEAGYAAGGVKSKLLVQNFPHLVTLSEVAQANLAEIGIDLQLEPVAQAAYQSVAGTVGQKYQMATGYTALGPPDPGHVFGVMFHSQGSRNYFGPYSNPQVDQMVEKAGSIYDEKERASLYQQAAQIVVDDAFLLPAYIKNNIGARNTKVRNKVHYADVLDRFREVWLAQ